MSLEAEFAEHAPFLRALARRLATDASTADDLVQETWLAALGGHPRRSHGLFPWLAAILRNRVARRIRTDGRRRRREQAVVRREDGPDVATVASRLEVARRLLQHVDALDADYRDVVFLRYYEDLKPRQIAARLDLPLATIKTRLARALARLRDRLDADDPAGRQHWLPAVCAIGGIEPVAASIPQAVVPVARRALALHFGIAAVTMLAVAALVWPLLADPVEPAATQPTTAGEVATVDRSTGREPDLRQALDPAPQFALVRGLVVDADFRAAAGTGRPAADVVVRCRLRQPAGAQGGTEVASPQPPTPQLGPRSRTIEVEVETVTDAEGRFQLELPEHAVLSAVEAVGTDFLREAHWNTWNNRGPRPEPFVLTRYPRGVLEGIVIDASGAVVANAQVRLEHWQGRERLAIHSVSDGNGRFVFPHVPADAWLEAECTGFLQVGATRPRESPRGGWHPARIVMAAAGTLIVEPVDSAGRPASGVEQIAATISEAETGLFAAMQLSVGHWRINEPVTGGRATLAVPAGLQLGLFAGLDPFHHELDGRAEPPGTRSPAAQPIVVAAGEERPLRIVFGTDATLHGTVVDPEGQPVAGADVSCERIADGVIASIGLATTDARGRFEHHVAAADDRQRLLVSARGSGASEGLRAVQHVRPSGVEPLILTMRLAPPQEIVGRVRDPEGRAVDAKIHCGFTMPGTGEPITSAGFRSTDANGAFRVPGLPDTLHRLEFVTAGFATVVRDGVRPGGAPIEVVLEQPKRARIRLRATASPALPTQLEVRVGYFDTADGTDPQWPVLAATTTWSHPTATSPPTSQHLRGGRPDGTWRCEDPRRLEPVDGLVELLLESGPAAIAVTGFGSHGEQLSRITTGLVTIADGEVELPIELLPTVTCRGRIEFDEHSERIAACVALADDTGRLLSIGLPANEHSWETIFTTSSHGHFALGAIPSGVWELQVGTRSELERGAARWRRRIVCHGDFVEPIVVQL